MFGTLNQRIQKFSAAGTFLTKWGAFGSGNGQFNFFATKGGVATDGTGHVVYMADTNNHASRCSCGNADVAASWCMPSGVNP